MTILFICVGFVSVFQLLVLYYAWRHRQDPLLNFSKQKRTQILIRLLNTLNDTEAIRVFSEALLSKSYGSLNLSQTEFIHQISEKNKDAQRELKTLVDPSQPHAIRSDDEELPETQVSEPGTMLDVLYKASQSE